MMVVSTIDDVIAGLDAIIEQSRQEHTRYGFFAALYRRTTLEVKHKCAEGYFEDNERLLALDVLFANHYLEAMDRHRRGQRPVEAWQVAFEAAHNPRLRLIQHLLLGMNAHIGFDLGLSVVGLTRGELSPSLRRDFFRLNDLLFGLINRVQDEIACVSPLLGWLDRMALGVDETLVGRSIEAARDGAWEFAEQLAQQPADQRDGLIARRDREVADFARRIVQPGALVGPMVWLACADERRHIPQVLDALTND
jgi:hypothetical protein